MLDLAGKPQVSVKPSAQLQSVAGPSYLHEIMAGIFVLIVLSGSVLVFFLNRAEELRLKRLSDSYDQAIQELSTGKYAEIAERVTGYTTAASIFRLRSQDGPVWSNLLQEVQKTTGDGIVLNTVSIDEKGVVKFDGTATNYQDLAKYLATLRATPVFVNIELIVTSLHETDSGKQVQFSAAFSVPTIAKLTTIGNPSGGGL